jgi:alginate O-acetyltransferase complex protein AlgI
VNLGIVFFLTGLWHGASFAFVFWGLYHGFFMILERLFLGKWLEKNPWKWVNHLYTMVVVICGWVFFRIDRITHGLKYVWRMLTFQQGDLGLVDFLSLKMLVMLVIAILLMGFFQEKKRAWRDALYSEKTESVLLNAVAILGLCYSILLLVSDAYNPFIYFRF